MGSWQVQDAKARFSEFLDATINKGPQVVTRRGIETAVLVSIGEWNRFAKGCPSESQRLAVGTWSSL
jgi:antitoxin Phd